MVVKALFPLRLDALVVMVLAGCAPRYTVEVLHVHPAQIPFDGTEEAVAVHPFATTADTDPQWARRTEELLLTALRCDDRAYGWTEVIGPEQLRATAKARAPGAPGDEQAAVRAAAAAGADAVITGVVHVDCHRLSLNGDGQQADSLRQTCLVRVEFRLADPHAKATLATRTLQRGYDSAAPRQDAADPDCVVEGLLDACVSEFAAMLALYDTRITVELRPGRTHAAHTGNRLASRGAWGEALALYRRSLQLHPDDADAVFNMGVVYEAAGKLQAAADHYDRAFRMTFEPEHATARDRVRRRIQHQ